MAFSQLPASPSSLPPSATLAPWCISNIRSRLPPQTLCIVLPAQDLSFSLNLCLAHFFVVFNFIYHLRDFLPTLKHAHIFLCFIILQNACCLTTSTYVLASFVLLLLCLFLLECEHFEDSDFSVLFHFWKYSTYKNNIYDMHRLLTKNYYILSKDLLFNYLSTKDDRKCWWFGNEDSIYGVCLCV